MKFANRIGHDEKLYAELEMLFPSKQIQPSFLRMEAVIANGQNVYQFLIDMQSNQVSTEQKLNQNDVFGTNLIGLFIYPRNTSTGNEGLVPLQTYPNVQVFPAVVGPPAFTPGDLNMVYSGFLQIARETTIDLEKFPTRKFLEIGTTQQASATTYSEVIGTDSGFASMVPTLLLPGAAVQQTTITLNYPALPSSIAWQAQAANTQNRLVLIVYGYVIKGVGKPEYDTAMARR